MQREPITRETVKLTPWDKVSLTRPWIVPLWLSTGEVVALNLRKTDLCKGDRRLVMTYQGLDLDKYAWLTSGRNAWVKPLALEALDGKRINLNTGEIVTIKENGRPYHMPVNPVGDGYRRLYAGGAEILWHMIEFEYQARKYPYRVDQIIDRKTTKYVEGAELQVHHRYEPLRGTSAGNRPLSLSLIPTSRHGELHGILNIQRRFIEDDSMYRARVCEPVSNKAIDNFYKEVAHDPHKMATRKG